MSEEHVFYPPRRLGLVIHTGVLLVLFAAAIFCLRGALQTGLNTTFVLYLFGAVVAVGGMALFAYRAYALQRAYYAIDRDNIHLRWGLRFEDIPMLTVDWVYPASELAVRLPKPWLSWPGAVLGVRRFPHTAGGQEIEFMASSLRKLILIGTSERIYAISPIKPEQFLHIFHRFTELGSLTPPERRSLYPSFLLKRLWADRLARWLILSGFVLCLVLLVGVVAAVTQRQQVSLGFQTDGSPGAQLPAVRLFLLPLINTFFYFVDLGLGLIFFRRPDNQTLAYLLWGSGGFTSLLFLGALLTILNIG